MKLFVDYSDILRSVDVFLKCEKEFFSMIAEIPETTVFELRMSRKFKYRVVTAGMYRYFVRIGDDGGLFYRHINTYFHPTNFYCISSINGVRNTDLDLNDNLLPGEITKEEAYAYSLIHKYREYSEVREEAEDNIALISDGDVVKLKGNPDLYRIKQKGTIKYLGKVDDNGNADKKKVQFGIYDFNKVESINGIGRV